MEEKLHELKRRLSEVDDIEKASAVLSWDQSTYMPRGGSEARARHASTLDRLAQEKFTDPAIGKLLDELQPYADSLPYDSDEASLIRVTRRRYERMTKVPSEFIGELSENAGSHDDHPGCRTARSVQGTRDRTGTGQKTQSG